MKNEELLYSQIRTPNMLPDRSADVVFEEDTSMTQQQFLRECDINVIVEQNAKTGFISHVNPVPASWGDFGDSTDFHSAQNYLIEANQAFMSLDAHVRARFANDPAQLLDFLSRPENGDEAVKLGLATYVSQPETTNPSKDVQKPSKMPPTQSEE